MGGGTAGDGVAPSQALAAAGWTEGAVPSSLVEWTVARMAASPTETRPGRETIRRHGTRPETCARDGAREDGGPTDEKVTRPGANFRLAPLLIMGTSEMVMTRHEAGEAELVARARAREGEHAAFGMLIERCTARLTARVVRAP